MFLHMLSNIRNSAVFGTPTIVLDYDGLFFNGFKTRLFNYLTNRPRNMCKFLRIIITNVNLGMCVCVRARVRACLRSTFVAKY